MAQTGSIPDISIVIPAFNCAKYIGATLDSVFAQTVLPTEVVVVDDGSTDDLDRALQPYLDRIRLVRQKNGGSASARNTGVMEAGCNLIQFVDGDDILVSTALEDQIRCMQTCGADVVYGDCVFWGSNFDGIRFSEIYPSNGPVTLDSVLARQCNVVYAVLAKRSALVEAGLFDTRMRLCEDMDLWVRMLRRGFRFAYHSGVLLKYRRQGQNKTSQQLKNVIWEGAMYWRFLRSCLIPVGIVLQSMCSIAVSCLTTVGKHLVPPLVRSKLRALYPGTRSAG